MPLRTKIIVTLAVVTLAWAAVDRFLLDAMVTREFQQLSEDEAARGIELVKGCITGEVKQLREKAAFFAAMDSVRDLFLEEQARPARAPLWEGALEDAGVHLMYLCEPGGVVRWGRAEDPVTREELVLRTSFPSDALAPSHPLLIRQGDAVELSYLTTERGIMLVTAEPIPLTAHGRTPGATTDSSGEEVLGMVVLGRFLDGNLKREIEGQVSLCFDVWDLSSPFLAERERELLSRVSLEVDELLMDTDDYGNPCAYKILRGLAGRPDLLLRADLDRSFLARGENATDYLLLSTIGTLMLIFLVLLRVLQRTVLDPLGRLTRFAVQIAETDDTTVRMGMERSDEIGILSQEFDRMLDEIERSRELLVQTAREAGMSEIATGVLHNVGNVLNSVFTSAMLIQQRSKQLASSDLMALVSTLEEHEQDLGAFFSEDPRGRHALPFLREIRDALERQRESLRGEAENLCEGVEHIAELVRAQQAYAGTRGVFEQTSLPEQVDAAVRICLQAYGEGNAVEILREYEPDLPLVGVDRHKLLEILVNLFQNAKQAVDDTEDAVKRIVLRLGRVSPDRLRIEVEDNGTGIASVNLHKIFSHGFTTKRGGHGFGLHVSANSAQEMGCTLSAESAGPGRGAKFILEIPIAHKVPTLAA